MKAALYVTLRHKPQIQGVIWEGDFPQRAAAAATPIIVRNPRQRSIRPEAFWLQTAYMHIMIMRRDKNFDPDLVLAGGETMPVTFSHELLMRLYDLQDQVINAFQLCWPDEESN